MRDIGKNIKDMRERKGLTQDELAELLFVTRQTVSNYENGRSRPDIDMLMKISQVLEADVNHLLYGLPEQEDRKREVRRLVIAIVVLAVLFLLSALSVSYLDALVEYRHITQPRQFLGAVFSPAFFLLLGWVLAQGTLLLFEVRLKPRPWFPWVRRILLTLLLICLILILPWVIWCAYCMVQLLTTTGPHSFFLPTDPIYQSMLLFLLRLNLQHTGVYALWGGILCLLGFPTAKTFNENKTTV